MALIGTRQALRAGALVLAVVLLGGLFAACGRGAGEIQAVSTPGIDSPEPRRETATQSHSPTATIEPLLPTEPPTTPTQSIETPSPVHTATTVPVDPTATVEPTSTPEPPSPDAPVIVIDPGHDLTTPGALGIEYQVVLRTAFVTQATLEAAGYLVFLTRSDNETVFVEDESLLPPNADDFHQGYSHAYAHASKALQFEPDLVLILHYNGHPNPDVRGMEIYYCEMGGDQNLVLAEIVRDELVIALQSIGYDTPTTLIREDLSVARGNRHFPSLGNVYDAPREWLHNRYSGIPVVLTEPLYMTNAVERPLLDDLPTHVALADAYVRAVDRYFGR